MRKLQPETSEKYRSQEYYSGVTRPRVLPQRRTSMLLLISVWLHLPWLMFAQEVESLQASKPQTTPVGRAAYHMVADVTPEPVIQPHSKVMLQLQRRLQAAERCEKVEQAKADQGAMQNKDMLEEDQQAESMADGPAEEKAQTKKAKKTERKPRAPNAGPMQEVMAQFMKSQKEQGIQWNDARKAWLVSRERQDVIASMTTPERKRRRFAKPQEQVE